MKVIIYINNKDSLFLLNSILNTKKNNVVIIENTASKITDITQVVMLKDKEYEITNDKILTKNKLNNKNKIKSQLNRYSKYVNIKY
jgi:hypothetical protein